MGLGAVAVAAEIKPPNAGDLPTLKERPVAQGPEAGPARPVADAGGRGPSGAVEEAVGPGPSYTPGPAPAFGRTTPIPAVTPRTVPLLFIREPVAAAQTLGRSRCCRMGSSSIP